MTKSFVIFLFDITYDQRVSGFILCEDFPKISFSRPQAIALVFFATTKNFQEKYILKYFGGSHLHARAAMANGLRRQCLKHKTWVQLSTWPLLLSNQDYIKCSISIFLDYDKILYNIFCLTLHIIRGYQVSFSVKTSQKSAFYDLKLSS